MKLKLQTNQNRAALALYLIIGTLIILSLTSCDPSKRIARIIKRHPELVLKDTVWRTDTILTKSVQKDTSFYYAAPDTVYVNEGKMHVKYYFNKDSTVYINGKCDADTIIKMYPVEVSNVSVREALTWGQKVKLWLWENGWWVALIIYLLWKIFGKVLKTYFPFLNFLG